MQYVAYDGIDALEKRKVIVEGIKILDEDRCRIDKKYKAKLICVGRNKAQNSLLNLFKYEKNFESYLFYNNIMKKQK